MLLEIEAEKQAQRRKPERKRVFGTMRLPTKAVSSGQAPVAHYPETMVPISGDHQRAVLCESI